MTAKEIASRFHDLESHEIANADALSTLERRTERDEAHIRQYVEDNSRLKGNERAHEEKLKHLQEQLEVVESEKRQVDDEIMKRDKELNDLKRQMTEMSGQLLSVGTTFKQKEKDCVASEERARHLEKKCKDLEREVKTQRHEMDVMSRQKETVQSENAQLRNQLDRMNDEKKALAESLRRADMRPRERNEEAKKQRMALEQSRQQLQAELGDRDAQMLRMKRKFADAEAEASALRNALRSTKDGAAEEIRRLRTTVAKLRNEVRMAAAGSNVGRSPAPKTHASPPPWACDREIDERKQSNSTSLSNSFVRRAAAPRYGEDSPFLPQRRANRDGDVEHVQRPKRWATASDLMWNDRGAEARVGATPVDAIPSMDPPRTAAVSVVASDAHSRDTDATTTSRDEDAMIGNTRLAPFATDQSEEKLQRQVYEFEQELMQHNLEKSRIRDKLTQMGARAGRTMAKRRAKMEMENRLRFLEERTSEIRMELRYFETT